MDAHITQSTLLVIDINNARFILDVTFPNRCWSNGLKVCRYACIGRNRYRWVFGVIVAPSRRMAPYLYMCLTTFHIIEPN